MKDALDSHVNWLDAGDRALVFITGPQNSGKSHYAESQLMSRFSRPLYVGTLPKSKEFQGRINRHVKRRTEHWGLVEFSGEETRDVYNFRTSSELADGILLDGVSSHLWLKHLFCGDRLESLMGYADRMLEMLIESSKPVVLVDCETPFPKGGQHVWFNDFMHEFHYQIGAMASNRIVFMEKQEFFFEGRDRCEK